MNRSEAAQLLGLAAAADRRTIGDADVLTWADLLHDVAFEDARQALHEHYRQETRWVMPADIRKRVKAARQARVEAAPLPAPAPEDADDPVRYRKRMRADIKALAERKSLNRAIGWQASERQPPEPYRQARTAADEHYERRMQANRVDCPWCHAHTGHTCTNLDGGPLRQAPAHDARLDIAQQQENPR